jgi:hypothetical protein
MESASRIYGLGISSQNKIVLATTLHFFISIERIMGEEATPPPP